MRKIRKVRLPVPTIGEPTWLTEKGEEQLSSLLNWYSYNKTPDDALAYFKTYIQSSHPEEADLVAKAEKYSLPNAIGWICRIALLTTELPQKFKERIEEHITKARSLVADVPPPTEEKKELPKVQVNLAKQLSEYLGLIEEKIDQLTLNDWELQVNWQELFSELDVKHLQARNIAEFYKKGLLAELKGVQEGTDEQLVEGYAHLQKKQLKKFVTFVEEIIAEAEKRENIAKSISMEKRKPRQRKAKSPVKQVERLKYMKEHENLKSVLPTTIVGATQLWVYNVKLRRLGVYVCDNVHGFTVKGCTILNYNPAESIAKTLRKPEEVIPQVLELGKVGLRKVLPEIRAKEKKLNGRINKDIILLRAL